MGRRRCCPRREPPSQGQERSLRRWWPRRVPPGLPWVAWASREVAHLSSLTMAGVGWLKDYRSHRHCLLHLADLEHEVSLADFLPADSGLPTLVGPGSRSPGWLMLRSPPRPAACYRPSSSGTHISPFPTALSQSSPFLSSMTSFLVQE